MAISSLDQRSTSLGFLQYNNPDDHTKRWLSLELQHYIASYLNDGDLRQLSCVNSGGVAVASAEFKKRYKRQAEKLGPCLLRKCKTLGEPPVSKRDQLIIDYFAVLKGRRCFALNNLQQLYKNGIIWSPESQYNAELVEIMKETKSGMPDPKYQEELEKITIINGVAMFLSEKLTLHLIPEEMRCFTKLKKLNLTGSNLLELPDIFHSFPDLEECVLSSNSQLVALPLSFQSLKNLKLLAVDGTKITGQELETAIKPLVECEESKLKKLSLDLAQLNGLSIQCKSRLAHQLDSVSVRVDNERLLAALNDESVRK